MIDRRDIFVELPGECWFLNDSRVHRVENGSSADGVVLLIQTYNLDLVVSLIESGSLSAAPFE